jgi:predicted secreted Zn-dependent protease
LDDRQPFVASIDWCAVSVDGVQLVWRKSTASAVANCVEVANSGQTVFVRDSKHPFGPLLAFTADEWRAFIAGVHAHEFDLAPD